MIKEKERKKMILEGILFVSGSPQPIKRLAKFLNLKLAETRELAEELLKDYQEGKRGLSLIFLDDKIQLTTSKEISSEIEIFLSESFSQELSPVLLETLSIIAYFGPLSRSQIEEIRGVNSYYPLRVLSLRGLIEKKEHPTIPNAYLYQISSEFLAHLGLNRKEELPDYEEFRKKRTNYL